MHFYQKGSGLKLGVTSISFVNILLICTLMLWMLGLQITTKYNVWITAIKLLGVHIKQFSTIQVILQFTVFSFYLAEIMCRKIHKLKS